MLNNEFWMPAPAERADGVYPAEPLSVEEEAVLRRLRDSQRTRKRRRVASSRKQRVALRRRRSALDGLARRDLRSLARILIRLGL